MARNKTVRGFTFFTGDVNWRDYGGTWVRQVSPRRWHFLRLTNMVDACGRDNDGHPTYVVELSEVDLDLISGATQLDAWKSCDGDCQVPPEGFATDNTTGAERDLVTAGCCMEYGARAPLFEVATNNAHAGIRECRAESYSLTADAGKHSAAMSRPVNRLGSTAAEYMTGDIFSAIGRGIDSGDPSARIIAKMYVAADGQTLGGKIADSDLETLKAKTGKVG